MYLCLSFTENNVLPCKNRFYNCLPSCECVSKYREITHWIILFKFCITLYRFCKDVLSVFGAGKKASNKFKNLFCSAVFFVPRLLNISCNPLLADILGQHFLMEIMYKISDPWWTNSVTSPLFLKLLANITGWSAYCLQTLHEHSGAT